MMVLGDGQSEDADPYRLYGLAHHYGDARLGSDEHTRKDVDVGDIATERKEGSACEDITSSDPGLR